ncbi:MAG: hypothetical protein WBM00_12345, partial [Solirubrobacterales bacterium]
MSEFEVEGEVLAEEDAQPDGVQEIRALAPYEQPASPMLRAEVRTAAIAAASGVLAGAATVA